MFVLGISGVTCSGKTTISNMLVKKFPNSLHFCQDKYFLPEENPQHVLIPELSHKNWELLTALDMEKMRADVIRVLERNGKDGNLLILEGYLLFRDELLSSYCQGKIYIDLPFSECQRRRTSRTYEPPDVPGYFEKIVWPEGQKNRKIVMDRYPDMHILDGSLPLHEIFEIVLNILADNGFSETK